MTDNPNAAADNLLAALNRSLAVIAFSPSGEMGRGFAVVANEVCSVNLS